jgi:DNA-directed RNA polymerase subunit RPC12/RpoP
MDLFLSTRCPQCGADISFDEESTVVYCKYCGSALHITGRSGVTRTYLAPREDVTRIKRIIRKAAKQVKVNRLLVKEKKLFFAPYWRIKGMAFRWVFGKKYNGEMVKELKTKNLDHTFPAYRGINLGLRSLGVRPAALRHLFFDHLEMAKMGSVLNVSVPFDQAMARGASLTDVGLDETGMRLHLGLSRLVGERYGVIYFPFWKIRLSAGKASFILILDGVGNQVTRVLTDRQWEDMEEATRQPASVSFSAVSFIPFKCPNCGWDLPLNRFDIIHLCSSCHRAWMEQGGRYKPVRFHVAAPPRDLDQNLLYLPFWALQTEVRSNGHSLKTAADLERFFALRPKKRHREKDGRPIIFLIPAAAIRNIAAANKLATLLTQNQPSFDNLSKERLTSFKLAGVFLPPRAATDMADILLCSLTPGKDQNRIAFARQAWASVSALHLVWWPFYEQSLFLRDAICGCGIQKGALADYGSRNP